MTTDVPDHPDSPLRPTGRFAVLIVLLVGTVTLAAGCKSPKKKATEVVKDALEKCRGADGDFHEVQLFAGQDSKEVLARTCEEEMGEVNVEEGHSAQVDIGPYTWKAAIEETRGLWVLEGVSWETLDQARSRLDREDPGENELKRAIELLAEAQETYPKSGWIRLERLETLLTLRQKTRPAESEDSYTLGEKANTHLEETLEWAKSNGRRATEARARLAVVDYHRSFARRMKDAKGALGSSDEALKKSIEVAERKGNEKEAEKYRKELEEAKEKRPEKRKLYDHLTAKAQTEMCGRLSHLKSDGIEDGDLKDRIESTKKSIDCRKLLKENKNDGSDDGEEGASE